MMAAMALNIERSSQSNQQPPSLFPHAPSISSSSSACSSDIHGCVSPLHQPNPSTARSNANDFPMEGNVLNSSCNSAPYGNSPASPRTSTGNSGGSDPFTSPSPFATAFDTPDVSAFGIGFGGGRRQAASAGGAGGAFVSRSDNGGGGAAAGGGVGVLDLNLELQKQLHTIEEVHAVFGSRLLKLNAESDVPNQQVVSAVAGTGLAPWEIHRPQKFVRDLVLRRCFSGRVLDSGCGIGDNALYVAKACPAAEVTAVDLVPRCLDFARTKAGLRGMRGTVQLVAADLRDYDMLPLELRIQPYDIVLDSYTFHGFANADRMPYVRTLSRLLRPGGLLYLSCMSEEETRTGGPRRVTVEEVRQVFCGGGGGSGGGGGAGDGAKCGVGSDGCGGCGSCSSCCAGGTGGWLLEAVEDSVVELHPTFWGGRAKGRVFTLLRLP